MKALYAGLAAMILIAVGAWAVLDHLGFSSEEVYSSPNVRLD